MLNEKLYEKFTPRERVNLMITALARADGQEAARLQNSCPMRECAVADPAYTERMVAINDIANRFIIILQSNYLGMCDKAYENIFIARLKAAYNAFVEFCKEVGIHSTAVFEWIGLYILLPNINEHLSCNIEADGELATIFKDKFLTIWHEYIN